MNIDFTHAKKQFKSDGSAFLNELMTNAIENEGWDLNNPNETMSEATRSLRDRYLRTKELYPEITNKDAIAGLSKVAKKAP